MLPTQHCLLPQAVICEHNNIRSVNNLGQNVLMIGMMVGATKPDVERGYAIIKCKVE